MIKNTKKIKIIGAAFLLVLASLPTVFGMATNTTALDGVSGQVGFEVKNIDETTIEINVNPQDFVFKSVKTEDGIFATISLPSYGFTYVKGEAKLPIIRRMIEIPQESNPEILVTSISWDDTTLDELNLPNRIIPAQQSVEKIPEPIDDFVVDEKYYSTDTFMPETIAKIVETGEIRSRRFALVEVSPIQYKPATGELKIINSCEIAINLPNSDMTKTYEKINRYSSPSFEKMFEVAFQNYGFYESGIENRDQEGILIIVYDSFYEEIQPLVNLKTSKGYDVTVTKTSQIPGGPTKENIYDYIEDAYNTWTIPPTYVLLVGDTPQIPTYSGTTGPSAVDLYYVTVDGSDYFPDIYIGRFPGSQESQIEAMVEKSVYYETGNFPLNEWIKKAAFLASTDNYQISEGTHNYVIDNFLNPNGYTCDKLYTVSYGATTQDVHDSINDGRSLVAFSGHGSPSGWGDGPSFYQSDVQALMNEDMYPFVCSHSCSTNTFDDSECFGETWLREADKGGIGFWGASASTYWDEDDILEKAMFQAWWEDDLEWLGGMTDMGLIYLYENYSGGGSTKYYFEAYNLNGDPSLRLWSDDPNSPPEIPEKPDGPSEGVQYGELTFSTSTTDPEGEQIRYGWDFDEDDVVDKWTNFYNSGETVYASHIWEVPGVYDIKVMAEDLNNRQSGWSEPLTVTIGENSAPEKPTITGPTSGKVGVPLDFNVVTTDPEGHDIYYMVLWGDGNMEDYTGPYASGEEATFSHVWSSVGEFNIIVKAQDHFGAKSPQNNLELSITKNKAVTNPVFLQLLEKLMDRFPFIERLLLNLC